MANKDDDIVILYHIMIQYYNEQSII